MFRKGVENPYGDNAEYWECIAINIDPIKKISVVQIALYKNKGAFVSGKAPQETKYIALDAANFPFGGQQLADLLGFIQQRVKLTSAFFSDAGFE
jgi:hypothetical protein